MLENVKIRLSFAWFIVFMVFSEEADNGLSKLAVKQTLELTLVAEFRLASSSNEFAVTWSRSSLILVFSSFSSRSSDTFVSLVAIVVDAVDGVETADLSGPLNRFGQCRFEHNLVRPKNGHSTFEQAFTVCTGALLSCAKLKVTSGSPISGEIRQQSSSLLVVWLE